MQWVLCQFERVSLPWRMLFYMLQSRRYIFQRSLKVSKHPPLMPHSLLCTSCTSARGFLPVTCKVPIYSRCSKSILGQTFSVQPLWQSLRIDRLHPQHPGVPTNCPPDRCYTIIRNNLKTRSVLASKHSVQGCTTCRLLTSWQPLSGNGRLFPAHALSCLHLPN